MKYIVPILQFLIMRRRFIFMLVTAMAKIGYLAYVLYGLIAWFQPGTLQDKLRRRESLWYCLFAVIIGSGISAVVGLLWHRPRPFVQYPQIFSLISHRPNASFPSNHSMNSMAIATTFLWCGNPVGWFFLPWSILLGASRVLCGVHYVTDVLGGFAFGVISAAIVTHSRYSKTLARKLNWYYHIAATLCKTWYNRW